jgi:threonine dehydratase
MPMPCKLQKQQGLTFVHPFDDPDVIAGQGTMAMEMLRANFGHQGAGSMPVSWPLAAVA